MPQTRSMLKSLSNVVSDSDSESVSESVSSSDTSSDSLSVHSEKNNPKFAKPKHLAKRRRNGKSNTKSNGKSNTKSNGKSNTKSNGKDVDPKMSEMEMLRVLMEQIAKTQEKDEMERKKANKRHKTEEAETVAKIFESNFKKQKYVQSKKTFQKDDVSDDVSDDETDSDTDSKTSGSESESSLEVTSHDKRQSRKRKRSKSDASSDEDSDSNSSDDSESTSEETPDLEVMKIYENGEITPEEIAYYESKYNKNKAFNDTIRNAVSGMPFTYLAINRDRLQQINFVYNHEVSQTASITNQLQSGRCWIFAGLNIMRPSMLAKYGLADFQFSQSYLFFWDKLERANLYLEQIMYHREKPLSDRLMRKLLHHRLCDGGAWDFFVNLINKYGVVPKQVYNESFNSSMSQEMNKVLNYKIHEYAMTIIKSNLTKIELREQKRKMMAEIYRLLVQFMGRPPTTFTWHYTDVAGQVHSIKNVTPLKFYKIHVPFEINNYILLAHDPRSEHKAYETYVTDYATGMINGTLCTYTKFPIERMKYYVAESIKHNEPVWFSCEMGADLLAYKNIMDPKMFDSEKLLQTSFNLSKEERFISGVSNANHAMVIVGVDEVKENEYRKWKVENSWGVDDDDDETNEETKHNRYLHMSDEWFSEHVYEVIVNKQYLTRRDQQLLAQNEDSVNILPHDDLFNGLPSGRVD